MTKYAEIKKNLNEYGLTCTFEKKYSANGFCQSYYSVYPLKKNKPDYSERVFLVHSLEALDSYLGGIMYATESFDLI